VLFRQATHLPAIQTEEVDVVAAALPRLGSMAAETPDAVDALDPVQQSSVLEGRQRPVERDPVDAADLGPVGDLVVGQRVLSLVEDLQHGPARHGPTQTCPPQELT